MLENLTTGSSATANISSVKRYAPPNQRNRSLGRRKSGGDRLERANSYGNDGEKNQINASWNIPITDRVDASGSNYMNENFRSRLISIHGCGSSEAFHLLNNRWTAAMTAHDNLPEDSAERPVLYTRTSAPSWGHAMLPHLLMQQTAGVKDFLSELRQAMRDARAGSDA